MISLAGRSILIVDCDAACLGRWRQRLLNQDARVICSSSIDSALANAIAFPAGTFHAVLIEHRPLRIDAFELAGSLRALPSMRSLPTIVIADAGDVHSPPAAGASAPSVVLRRPVTVDEVSNELIGVFAPLSVPWRRSGASPSRRMNYRGTILVAEDDPVNAEIMRAMLGSLGLDVVQAVNGAEAVACTVQRAFDLVFMDAEMPVIDGLESTRRIRARETGGVSRQAIVCVTANAVDSYRTQCLAAGMDDLLAKPVAIATLLGVLARWLPAPTMSGVRDRVASSAGAEYVPLSGGEARPQPTAAGPIDWSQVESLRTVDPQGANGIVGKAIDLYIDHAPRLIEEILTYRVTGDLRDVKQAAHSLRSSSASLGASAVAGLSATIESAAGKGDFEIIDSVVGALESEYRRAEAALRSAIR